MSDGHWGLYDEDPPTHAEILAVAGLTVTCETCGGSGDEIETVPVGHFVHRPCPDCTDGRRVNPEAIEALRSVIAEMRAFNTPQEVAEAGLRAVIEAAGREKE